MRRLSCLLLFILLLTTLTPHQALAKEKQKDISYFSFLENYLIAYTVIDAYNKRVLAAHTKATVTQQHMPPQTPPLHTQQNIPPPGNVSSYILQEVNAYRASLGLYQVQSSTQTCAFAQTRAQEITNGFTHDGFYNRVNNHTIPYSSWSRAVENIAQAPDYKEVVTLWKNSPGHAANMRDNTPYVCIMQNGSYYAYEGMRP